MKSQPENIKFQGEIKIKISKNIFNIFENQIKLFFDKT